MLTKKKKIFMLAGMVILLAATVWLNAALAANAEDPPGDVLTGSFFANFRAERKATRQETMVYLDSIINTTEAEYAEQRQTSMEQKQKLIDAMEMETNIENILRAQGFEDIGVTISVATDNVTVIVQAEASQEVTAKIYHVLWEQAQIDANNVSMTFI